MSPCSFIVPVHLFKEPETGHSHVAHTVQIPQETEASIKEQNASVASQIRESRSLKESLVGESNRAAWVLEVIYIPSDSGRNHTGFAGFFYPSTAAPPSMNSASSPFYSLPFHMIQIAIQYHEILIEFRREIINENRKLPINK